ncbi:MAG: DEAD/DEAH box helicase, partial [Acidimicrobiia bacterium]
GEVTNDTVAPLRAFLWGKVRRAPGRQATLPSSVPPSGTGRWYLVQDLLDESVAATASAAARAEQMLERHGVVVRDAVLNEGVPGGFAGLYPVLAAMEDTGRVRRGYFVEGLGGAQFALPGAIDRLRAASVGPERTVVLAAADPANPYGAAIRWPPHRGGRPGRSAGAFVVLVAGRPAAFLERGGRRALTLTDDPGALDAVADALGDLAESRLRRMAIETIDGAPAEHTPLGQALRNADFAPSFKGLAYRGRTR